MKTKSESRLIVVLALAAMLGAGGNAPAQAANRWWDGGTADILTDGNGLSGGTAGNWNETLLNWDAGAVPHVAWVNSNNDTAIFGGTAGTVTLTAPVTVGGLQFSTTAYTLTGDTLTFGAGDNSIVLNNIAAVTRTDTVAGSGNVTLTAANPATAGTLTLNGTSTVGWSGTTTINPAATLSISGLNQGLLNTTGITLNGGGITLTYADDVAQDDLDRVNDGAGITANSGTITYTTTTAGSTKTFIETIGSVTLNRGQLNLVQPLNKTAGSQTLALSGLTQSGTSAITFANAGGLDTVNDIIRVNGITTSTTAGQIIGPWATAGTTAAAQTDYAVYNSDGANGRVVPAAIAANNTESTWGSGANITLTGMALR